MPDFNQFSTKLEDLEPYLDNLKNEYRQKIIGSINYLYEQIKYKTI